MSEKQQMLLFMTAMCGGFGAFFLSAALWNWNWFFEGWSQYAMWVKLFGRTAVRVFVGLLGLCFCCVPLYLYLFKW